MATNLFPIVLVVDDDRGQVALVSSGLKQAGFRVVSADSPLKVLAALKAAGDASNGISLLVTDLDMPDMNGRELATKLVDQNPGLKVLYITANADSLFRGVRALQPHEAFLEKPVNLAELKEAATALLHGSTRPRSD